jgi:hypothetical protein
VYAGFILLELLLLYGLLGKVYDIFLELKVKRLLGWYESSALIISAYSSPNRTNSASIFYSKIVYSDREGSEYSNNDLRVSRRHEEGSTITILIHPRNPNRIFEVKPRAYLAQLIPMTFMICLMFFVALFFLPIGV